MRAKSVQKATKQWKANKFANVKESTCNSWFNVDWKDTRAKS